MVRWMDAAAWGLTLALLGVSSCASGNKAGAGHDARDDLVMRVQRAHEDLARAQGFLRATLESYNGVLTSQGEQRVSRFEAFAKSLKKSESSFDRMEAQIEQIDQSSITYFSKWEEDIQSFQGEKMRQRGEHRLHTVRRRYGQVRGAMEPATVQSLDLLSHLHDQMLYLKYDLSPESLSFVDQDAAVLNRTGAALLTQMDTTLRMSAEFMQSLSVDAMSAAPSLMAKPAQEPSAVPPAEARLPSTEKTGEAAQKTAPRKPRSSSTRSNAGGWQEGEVVEEDGNRR